MTRSQFQRLLNKVSPNLRLRDKGTGNVIGVFSGKKGRAGYICRMSKGEVHLNGYRLYFNTPDGPTSRIKSRGRKTVINLLRSYRWITNHKQRTMLTYGVNYSDSEVRGHGGRDQYD